MSEFVIRIMNVLLLQLRIVIVLQLMTSSVRTHHVTIILPPILIIT